MNIRNFKIGDCIYRTAPADQDGSYMNEKMIFVGIKNGIIHLIKGEEERYSLGIGRLVEVGIKRGWDENWELWESTEEMYDTAIEVLMEKRKQKTKQRIADMKKSIEVKTNKLISAIIIKLR